MALYFECRINKNALLSTVFFFGDFAHLDQSMKTNLDIVFQKSRYCFSKKCFV